MFKILTLLILIMFNLNFYTQVVIKDEIDLQGNESPDAEFFIMPFYGYAKGGVNAGSIENGEFRKVTIEANNHIEIIECPCGAGCPYVNDDWRINDLPQGTVITVRVYEHCVNGQPVETPMTRYTYNPLTEYYTIEYLDSESNTYNWAATLKCFDTPPPGGCDGPTCAGPPEDPGIYLNVVIVPENEGTICEVADRAAGFQTTTKIDPNSVQIEVCFNEQSQSWQYKFANGHTVISDVNISYCEQNINKLKGILVNDYQDITNYPCDKLIRDLMNHFTYPITIDRGGGYVLKSILTAHELKHKEYYQNILENMKHIINDEMYRDLKDCIDLPNEQSAIIYFTGLEQKILIKYFEDAIERFELETGLKEGDPLKELKNSRDESRTHFKIYKFITKKIIAARIYHHCF